MKQIFTLIITVTFLCLRTTGFSQVTVTSSDSLTCTLHCTTLTAHVVGDTPTNSGITIDDIFETTPDPIGFTFYFYGTPYTSCLIGPNGNICFDLSQEGMFTNWAITAPLLGNPIVYNTICGPWEDIDIVFGGNITYSLDGTAPNRKYVITYCATHMFGCTTQFTTSQVILYETTNIIEVHLTHKDICTTWNPSGGTDGGRAIIGVQNATGTVATAAPGRDWIPVWSATDEAWRFTPISGGTDYSVASIAYAPIPIASDSVYWYNASTGAFIGSGESISVCPVVTTTYRAGVLGCADTSFGYYTVTQPGDLPTVTYTYTNPDSCGVANGTITLHAHGITPGVPDTFYYSYNGVPQPSVIVFDSNVTLTGLCSGMYSNIYVTRLCSSAPVGPVTLTGSTIAIGGVTTTSPLLCGGTGSLTIDGLYAGRSFIINYTLGGVAQPPVTATSSGSGTITLTGLCAGVYSNITATYTGCSACTTPPVGPYTIVSPSISISSVTLVNPALCGGTGSMVLNGLYPGTSFTVNYDVGGVAQPPLVATSTPSGTITLTGLCAGTYSGITASFTSCNTCITPAMGPYVLSAPAISISSVTVNGPTQCGGTGSLVLNGLYPGKSFTVNYELGGVAQPPVIATSTGTGTITLTGLCSGTYSSIVAYFTGCNTCTTPAVGPYIITGPAISISGVSVTNPALCGGTGSLTLSGLYPGTSFTVNYDLAGVAQAPVTATASVSGTITLSGLCPGTYNNIVASFTACGTCVTPPAGPYTITGPSISISGLTFTEPTGCKVDDGTITLHGLYPGQTYTVTFDSVGVAAATRTLTADGSGTVTITGLAGDGGVMYNNIIATFTGCTACTTPPAGPETLVTPSPSPVNLSGTPKSPTQCGYCDGVITLKSVIPFSSDTVYYSLNGAPQPPIITNANADSSITLGGLCAGVYNNFNVKVNYCFSGVTGSATLIAPRLFAGIADNIHLGCHGDTVVFTNNSSFPGAASPLAFYAWDFGDISPIDSAVSPTHIYVSQGTYTVTLAADNHVCSDDTSVVVSLIHPLHAGFNYSPVTAILCQGDTVTYTDTSSGGIVSREWFVGNSTTASNTNSQYIYHNAGMYNTILVVTDNVPCSDTATVMVEVDSQSNITLLVTDSAICRSAATGITGVYTSSGNTGITWNFGDGDSLQNMNPVTHSYDATGTFTITGTAHYRACKDVTAGKTVNIFPMPEISLGPADTSICAGSDPLILSDKINSGKLNASWVWSTGQTGPEITVTSPGIYTATVSIDGCKSSYTVDVANDCYMDIPNVFTPNGDGLNDYFFPRTLLASGLISFNMNIYNRWGALIFQSTSLDGKGWDGRLNGVDQPEGVFVYIIDASFKDGQKEHHQGNVTLLR